MTLAEQIVRDEGFVLSEATMQARDLIPRFARALAALAGEHDEVRVLLDEAAELEDFDGEQADDVLTELFDLLDNHAPTGFWFGANEWDRACYGFWTVEEEETT